MINFVENICTNMFMLFAELYDIALRATWQKTGFRHVACGSQADLPFFIWPYHQLLSRWSCVDLNDNHKDAGYHSISLVHKIKIAIISKILSSNLDNKEILRKTNKSSEEQT